MMPALVASKQWASAPPTKKAPRRASTDPSSAPLPKSPPRRAFGPPILRPIASLRGPLASHTNYRTPLDGHLPETCTGPTQIFGKRPSHALAHALPSLLPLACTPSPKGTLKLPLPPHTCYFYCKTPLPSSFLKNGFAPPRPLSEQSFEPLLRVSQSYAHPMYLTISQNRCCIAPFGLRRVFFFWSQKRLISFLTALLARLSHRQLRSTETRGAQDAVVATYNAIVRMGSSQTHLQADSTQILPF